MSALIDALVTASAWSGRATFDSEHRLASSVNFEKIHSRVAVVTKIVYRKNN
jgi:hypothetical protein